MSLHGREIRQDVRELGALVGETVAAQAGTPAYEVVEELRTAAVSGRNDGRAALGDLTDRLEGLTPETQRTVAQAFTTYFELINLAEERERVRAVRSAEDSEGLADGFGATVDALVEADADAETVQAVLDDVRVVPTFTAHPTEARRKSVKTKLRRIARRLDRLDEVRLTDREAERTHERLAADVTGLWRTPQLRDRAPEPLDEARNVQWYLHETLFDVVGEVYRDLEDRLAGAYPDVEVPQVLSFRSWAGSDRDGNPNVTPDVTEATLARQRRLVCGKYREALDDLVSVLGLPDSDVPEDAPIYDSLAADRERLPGVAERAAERYPAEPFRQQLTLVRERVDRVGDVRPGGYEDADDLLSTLDAVAETVRAAGAPELAREYVDPLRRQVETFGLTFAGLDLRDHRENHTEAVGAVLAAEGVDYAAMDETERVEVLTESILQDEPVVDLTAAAEGRLPSSDGSDGAASGTVSRVAARFQALADWQREYGPEAVDTYCISMTEEPSHVLEVLFLADQAGVVDHPDHAGLDVVPLLETASALAGARRIMGTLFENEAYEQVLANRGGTQEVMLGYSDSNKENGFLAASWDLQQNAERLGDIADEFGVDLRLFHGRGGSISRGGGPMNEALLALPDSTVTGEVKFTEQGEAIAEKYANPRIARRNVELMLDAQLRARARVTAGDGRSVPDAWTEAMNDMGERAREAYRDLLATDGFVSYFEQATPITVIEDLGLGSRPASRSGERTVEDLRAIPWVFSWTQSRCILTGWYALGTGLAGYVEEGPGTPDENRERLREMYREWPFFRSTLDNAALALARTDFGVAERYADLAEPELREQFFPRLREEYERGVEQVLAVTDREELLRREWLTESLARRNPYVDPLNALQANLLGQEHRTPAEETALRLTVTGIAAGMKNTG